MRIAPVLTDKKGKKYIETGGIHDDHAYILVQKGYFVVTKPFRGGGLTFSGYCADYRVYDLRCKRGFEQANQVAEFDDRQDALDYLDFIINKRTKS